MAIKITNSKGFLVLKMLRPELPYITEEDSGCDFCNRNPLEGYYIGVLNSWYCNACYEEWMNNPKTIRYEEDIWFEERRFKRMCEMLRGNF